MSDEQNLNEIRIPANLEEVIDLAGAETRRENEPLQRGLQSRRYFRRSSRDAPIDIWSSWCLWVSPNDYIRPPRQDGERRLRLVNRGEEYPPSGRSL